MKIRRSLLLAMLVISILGPTALAQSAPERVVSPNGHLAVEFWLNAAGAPRYTIWFHDQPALQESKLGLVRDDADFTSHLSLVSRSEVAPVDEHYELLTGKRRVNNYTANRRIFHLQAGAGQKLDICFQVSNDGVAFRYAFPETSRTVRHLKEEVSSFHLLPGTRAWLQPIALAKSGWSRTNPSYEELYEKDIPVGTLSPMAGWVYPALFRSGETWLLVSETALGRNYCGTRLRPASPDGEYSVGFPDPRENFRGGAVAPESTLPWVTPWRIIVVGSLKTIAESTLGTDLAEPAGTVGADSHRESEASSSPPPAAPSAEVSPAPGKAAWSWALLKDGATTFDVQKRFIDYAADMDWHYCLIDALWDKQIGYDKLKELVDYGRAKHVAILVWYNSAGDWNDAPQTPRDKMVTHESRVREFDRLKAIGVAGLKIDFFGGDGQSMINYYQDILADAAPYGFAMNFHGATLPRGWERTYPHLMTMEAIRGEEFVTFEQKNADEEATHAAMLPFTRNVFDPMDFTPVVLDHIPRIQRRTTSAFELALSVVFTSGITHYAETPAGMARAPDYVRDFLKAVPGIWDDTRFLDGFPGQFVVLARQGAGRWYLAGINAEAEERKLTLNLRDLGLGEKTTGVLIGDGDGGNLSFVRVGVTVGADQKLDVTLAPHGGFVAVFE